jgi:Trk K+ transport system NAD-binding subunit
VLVYNDVEKSYQVGRQARLIYGIRHVVARVDDPQDIERFEKIGVVTMNTALDRASLLAILARNPGMFSLLSRTDDDKDIGEVTVKNTAHFGRQIREVKMPGEVLILALHREGEVLIPAGDTRLERGDRLSLLGEVSCIEEAMRVFS